MHDITQGPSRRSFLGLGVAAAGAASLSLAGCGASPGPQSASATPQGNVSLTMSAYGSNTRQHKLQQVFKLYAKKNGGKVGLELLANEAYAQKLATQIAGGAAADVVALFHNSVAQYASKNALAPLDRYGPKVLDLSHVDKESSSGGVIDGKRVALPLGDNAYGVIWDKTALADLGMSVPEPGHTWDDFITFANDVKKKAKGRLYGTIDNSADFNGFQVFVRQRGKELYKDGKLGFSKADLEAWFAIWAELRKSGAAPPGDLTVQTATGGFGNSLLVTGKAPNFFIYPNVLSGFQALTKNELAVSTIPMTSASKSGLFVRASNWAAVNARSSHPADAAALLGFMLNDEQAARILQAEFAAPPNLELRKVIEFNKVDRVFIDYVELVSKEFAQPVPSLAEEFPSGSPQVMTAFVTAGQSVATGQQSISSGTDSFFSQAEGFLS
ncbi:ABC transporter substrate-binding protein [Streptomyces acidicola]|uniref:Carbohydrate ABC transporter substrate-binding protein n=1 Tax=Streptomyces acidicola TaxID=2596892 RepID=A0A5N8WLQ2_9ACTN|nr:ABC transporter substrate-binding protein [Streptomyces acidicola]MPY47454.1 carbohydrate ABC transporter substrate-binding protein [Streptomyces acidicola]